MVLIGFSDTLSLAQSIGIVGTMVLTLYFSKRQIHALSIDQETRVLNDLDEKFHSMAMLAKEDPSIARVIDTRDYANKKETAFSFYILWMCAHAYAMRQRRVLDDNEWAGWLQWMRNCFHPRGFDGRVTNPFTRYRSADTRTQRCLFSETGILQNAG